MYCTNILILKATFKYTFIRTAILNINCCKISCKFYDITRTTAMLH